MAKEQGSNDPGTAGGDTTDKTVSSATTKKAAAKKATSSSTSRTGARKATSTSSKSTALEVGAEATADVHLKMEGGYGDAFLVPGKADDGQPGVLLVQKGDVITHGAVRRMERAEANAKRLKG